MRKLTKSTKTVSRLKPSRKVRAATPEPSVGTVYNKCSSKDVKKTIIKNKKGKSGF